MPQDGRQVTGRRTREPPDGGWGWMVALGSAVVGALVTANIFSFGVFINEFRQNEKLKYSVLEAIWIPTMLAAIGNGVGVMTSVLVGVYSARFISILGGALLSLGISLGVLTTDITVLYITYGLLGGIGSGLCLTSGFLLLSVYFKKRLSLAFGSALLGPGLGCLIFPPLVDYLMYEYGFHGCLLIVGGTMLNCCVAGSLYRPLEAKRRRRKRVVAAPENDDDFIGRGSYTALHQKDFDSLGPSPVKICKEKISIFQSIARWWRSRNEPKEMFMMAQSWNNPGLGAHQNGKYSPTEFSTPPSTRRLRTLSIDSSRILPGIPEEPEEEYEDEDEDEVEEHRVKCPMGEEHRPIGKLMNGYGGNSNDDAEVETDEETAPNSTDFYAEESLYRRHVDRKSFGFQCRLSFCPSVWKRAPFYVKSAGYSLFVVTLCNYVMYVPVLAVSLGMTKAEGARLLSYLSIPSLVTHLIVPPCSGYFHIRPKYLHVFCGAVSTASIAVTPFMNEHVGLRGVVLLFSFGGGGFLGIFVSTLLNIVDKDKIPAFLSLVSATMCLSFLTVTPILGFLADETSQLTLVMLTLAALQAASTCLVILDNFIS